MGSSVKRIVISGYYGFRNSGDEAVLQSILLALRQEGEAAGVKVVPVVLSIDPEWTSRTYGVEAVHRMKLGRVFAAIRSADGLVSGGGSLLQDVTGGLTIPYYIGIMKLALWLRKPVFIYSQGIGPVHNRRYYGWIRRTFGKCRYVSVRDAESAALLESMGCAPGAAEVVPDPVLGLPLPGGTAQAAAPESTGERLPVVGISVRYWNADRSELDKLAEAIVRLSYEREMEVRFLPFHLPSDEEASYDVIGRVRIKAAGSEPKMTVVGGIDHPQRMLAEVSRCDVLVGMRLHALIYAASQLVPMVGITYDPKIDQFLHRLESTPAASTEAFDPAGVAAEIGRLLDNRDAWTAAKRPLVDRLKQQASRPAQQIIASMRL
ncbi:polysaccharide pyruvyl transferase CsaB [Paenibacillus cymbidii]|uniref:polysaccharide pyruvyl transferase CsaB n=1 Tax=Paenibacillus cymbidii TaxID=1639034 RepID=UPI001081D409|nr:polysaccharide pyruvyl transferase CsaB [Paenibacillus cymbidii]